MMRWVPPLLILVLGLLAASVASRTPAPLAADAPPAIFSAGRAMADVRAIAQKPHPMGSPEQARVQAYLLARMTALGLSPQVRPFVSAKGPGRNLLGILPGRDRSTPALMLMAHTDSVPTGPGAADDGAGVAAVLETVRALQTAPRQRDVMVLLTDGEEPGLMGSKAFFAADPMREHVGVVINLEARGNRGRAMMFETHRDAAPLIGALISTHALSSASSLMPDLYRRLPNDTDLTQALKSGHDGLNFAFLAGFDAYHRPTDTPTNLDPGSLQHLGSQVLAAAGALAAAPALPSRAPDQAYADVMGGPILQYPAWMGWALLLVSAGGMSVYALRLAAAGRLSLLGVAAGAGAFLVLLLVVAGVLIGLGAARIALAGHHLAPLLRHDMELRTGLAVLVLGLAVIWWALATRWLSNQALAFGALGVLAIGALALQAAAPLDAFVLVWPFILIGLALLVCGPDNPWISWMLLAAAEAQVLYWTLQLFDLVGQVTPVALTPFALLIVAAALPICPQDGKRLAPAGAGAMAVGLGLCFLALVP